MQFTSIHLFLLIGFLSLCVILIASFSVVIQGDPGPPGYPGFIVSLTFIVHLVITETEQSGVKR